MAPLSVLVVDDDAAIRDALACVLESEGFEVAVAENGEVALDAIRTGRAPDVMVLDLMMPVLSGWEVLEIVDAEPDLQSIPILVLSAMCAPLAPPGLRGGVKACLSKPVRLEVLIETVKRLASPLLPPANAPFPQGQTVSTLSSPILRRDNHGL